MRTVPLASSTLSNQNAAESPRRYENTQAHPTKKRLEFVHITKTGGTAIERAAQQQGVIWGFNQYRRAKNFRRAENERFEPPRSIGVPFDGELWHTPPHWRIPNPYRDADTFAVIRNPYTRYLSEYFCRHYGWRGRNSGADDAVAANDWIQKYIHINQYDKQNAHMLPQHYFIYDEETGKQQVNHIVRYEDDLPRKLNLLANQYGLNIRLPSKQPTLRKTTIRDLSVETIRVINQYAAKDFELLNYSMVLSASEFVDGEGSIKGSQ